MTESFTEEELNMISLALSYTTSKLEENREKTEDEQYIQQIDKTLRILHTASDKLKSQEPLSFNGEELTKIYVSLFYLRGKSEQALDSCTAGERNTILDCKLISNRIMRKLRGIIPGIEASVGI